MQIMMQITLMNIDEVDGKNDSHHAEGNKIHGSQLN